MNFTLHPVTLYSPPTFTLQPPLYVVLFTLFPLPIYPLTLLRFTLHSSRYLLPCTLLFALYSLTFILLPFTHSPYLYLLPTI